MAPAFLVEEMKKEVDEEARAVVVMDRDAQNLSGLHFWEHHDDCMHKRMISAQANAFSNARKPDSTPRSGAMLGSAGQVVEETVNRSITDELDRPAQSNQYRHKHATAEATASSSPGPKLYY